MEDLRHCWKVPYIVYYCNLFDNKLDLVDLRVDEFEEAIIDDCGLERNIVIIHLLQKLLKPFINRSVDLTNFEQFLLSVLKKYSLENLYLQEDQLQAQLSSQQASNIDDDKQQQQVNENSQDTSSNNTNKWHQLSMLTKLDIIYTLCELRLQLPDTELKLTEYEPNEMRIEPLGIDSNGNKLWYFGDLRLYEEKPPIKEKKKKTDEEKKPKSKGGKSEAAVADKVNTKSKNETTSKTSKKQPVPSKKQEELETKKNQKNSRRSHAATETKRQEASPKKIDAKLNKSKTAEPESSTLGLRRSSRRSLIVNAKKEEEEEEETVVNKSRSRLSTTLNISTRRSGRKKIDEEEEEEDDAEENYQEEEEKNKEEDEDEDSEKEDDDDEEDQDVDVDDKSNDKESKDGETTLSKSESTTIKNETSEQNIKNEPTANEDVKPKLEGENDTKLGGVVKQEEIKLLQQETSGVLTNFKKEHKPVEELEMYKNELKYWNCVCLTLDDWIGLNEKYKASKKKLDQDISHLIETSYLPEMPALFQKAEKERMQRLLALAPKRQSQRLQSKQQKECYESDSTSHNGGLHGHHNTNSNSLFDSADDFESNDEAKNNNLPLTEQEKLRRDEIAKQREERLKQRLLRRENQYVGDQIQQLNDETSQASSSSHHPNSSSDFNIKNYFLMHKVLTKILQSKYAWPFKTAVIEEDAPDYFNIIKNPMDLSTIQLKINSKTYKTRYDFIKDLDLIVSNCLTYNGDDTFYGKLAKKFENYYKRWLQIFYPREISTSLEEKNRQLMSMNRNNQDENENNENADGGLMSGHNDYGHQNGENGLDGMDDENNGRGGSLLFDFSNNNDMLLNGGNGSIKKKRKSNADKDKYIQEPQYVTKRTSSGRLVKMKIINDYDYTSDQELEAKKRKREDGDDKEGIQLKHRKEIFGENGDYNEDEEDEEEDDDEIEGIRKPKRRGRRRKRSGSSQSNPSDSDDTEDEDYGGTSRRNTGRRQYKSTPGPGRPPLHAHQRQQRRTIKQLTESGLLNQIFSSDDDDDRFENDSDNDLNLANFNKRFNSMANSKKNTVAALTAAADRQLHYAKNNANNLNNVSSSGSDSTIYTEQPKLTFEQYVKKLTGSYTVNGTSPSASPAPTPSATPQPNGPSSTGQQIVKLPAPLSTNGAQRFSLKITPAQSLSPSTTTSNQSATTTSTTTTTTTSAKVPLTIPIINPAIKAALSKYNQHQQQQQNSNIKIVNTTTTNIDASSSITNLSTATAKTLLSQNNQNINTNLPVKIVTSTSTNNTVSSLAQSKKILIVNNASSLKTGATTTNQPTTTTTTPNSTTASNLIKIININNSQLTTAAIKTSSTSSSTSSSSSSSSPMLNNISNRPQIIMINSNSLLNGGSTGLKATTNQLVAPVSSSAISIQQAINTNSSNINSSSSNVTQSATTQINETKNEPQTEQTHQLIS